MARTGTSGSFRRPIVWPRYACRAAAIVAILLLSAAAARAQVTPTYAGAHACAACHAAETRLWQKSHHASAMREPTDASVLGDFNNARVEHFGTTSLFYRDGEKFMVRTDGPDGALRAYEIAYTFGVYPLQQYLIAFPDGRYQALGIAWDSRAKDRGGQRWFHLYPDQKLPPGDRLHWTGLDQTWNYMCADCHSTNLHKNYDLGANSYATDWTDVDVSCEACHGPGSRHIALMQSRPPGLSEQDRLGLVAWLKATDQGHWEMNPDTGIAHRTEPLTSAELDACGACHSRRKVLAANSIPGGKLLDAYLPSYLVPGLYHPDGQIDGEVFEYGSFLQSRMHAAGVTCSNCHEPHSLELRAQGNALCAQCHLPAKFDTASHHHHAPGSTGAECVSCHMPTKTYMVVDARRDHSIRVPRPDLSRAIGTPNACTQCHTDRSADWAAQRVSEWFPRGRQTTPHYGTALNAGRIGAADAEPQLDSLIADQNAPAIARGTALLLLPPYMSGASEATFKAAAVDPDPLVRVAVARALPAQVPPSLAEVATRLLMDPIRAVRIEAARALAGVDLQSLGASAKTAYDAAYAELVAAETIDADRPEAHLNLGLLALRRRQPDEAEAQFRTALRLDANSVPALVDLADLDRMRGMDTQGDDLLRRAVAIEPGNADAHYALGLLQVRQRNPDAMTELRRANELAPGNARYAYVYAVALNSSGAIAPAMALLERTHQQHPADRDVLVALVSIARQQGDLATALRHARELAALIPDDGQIRQLVQQLTDAVRPR